MGAAKPRKKRKPKTPEEMGLCATCTRWRDDNACAVLKAMLGESGACWAHTQDPVWERKVAAATKAYAAWLDAQDGRRRAPGLFLRMKARCPQCGRANTPYSFGLHAPGTVKALYRCAFCGETWRWEWEARKL